MWTIRVIHYYSKSFQIKKAKVLPAQRQGQKLLGKLKFCGRLALVLPWYIICSGRNSPDKEITILRV